MLVDTLLTWTNKYFRQTYVMDFLIERTILYSGQKSVDEVSGKLNNGQKVYFPMDSLASLSFNFALRNLK